MKRKVLSILIIGAALLLLIGCNKTKKLEVFTKDKLEEKASEVFETIQERDFDKLRELASDSLKEELTDENIAQIDEYLDEVGEFKKIKKKSYRELKEKEGDDVLGVVYYNVQYFEQKINYTFTFDKDYNFIGLLFR